MKKHFALQVKAFRCQTITPSHITAQLRIVDNRQLQEAHGNSRLEVGRYRETRDENGETENGRDTMTWVDTKGVVLEFEEKIKKKAVRYAAKIPPGVNLIITFPVVIPWPTPSHNNNTSSDIIMDEPKSSTPLVTN